MTYLRSILAVWAGKLAIVLSRVTGRGGGTSFPGKVAMRIDPQILRRRARMNRCGNLIVTGTNGKTTTSRLIAAMLMQKGHRVLHNRSGANLYQGLITAMVAGAGWWGRGTDYGLFEVDEATVPLVVDELQPTVFVVTNFFRDQLDRFGEIDHTVRLVRQGLEQMPENGTLVLNSDDPLAAGLGEHEFRTVRYYGVDLHEEVASDIMPANSDGQYCRHCGSLLVYERRFLAHLGRYHCPSCRLRQPEADVRLVGYREPGVELPGRLEIEMPDGHLEVDWQPLGFYNVYNALAAVTAAWCIGIPAEVMKSALALFQAPFGRMESLTLAGGRHALLTLVKNPVGFDQALRTVSGDPDPDKLLMLSINDLYADGTDVSWLWDVQFEQLLSGNAPSLIVASGIRADEMALRLKYAGWPAEKTHTVQDPAGALRFLRERSSQGDKVYILATYTAMLQIRRVLQEAGQARSFWHA